MPRVFGRPVLSKQEIGARIRALRLEREISQVELAERVGTHQTAISQVEIGRRGVSLQQVVKLAQALEVTPDQIIGNNNGGAPPSTEKKRSSRLLRRVEKIQTLPQAKQRVLLQMIDAFIEKHGRSEP